MTDGFERLRLTVEGPVARIVLARPEVRNAFDDGLIEELTRAFGVCAADPSARVVVLSGDGPSFCAGADVNWMRRAGTYSREENERDAERMKMEHSIRAPRDGVIRAVHVREGDLVDAGMELADIE